MIAQRKFARKRRLTREQKQEEEMKWKKINEDIELKNEGVDCLLDSYGVYSVEVIGYLLAPLIGLFLMVFFKQTQIPENYGIQSNEIRYYTMFAVYMIPWSVVVDVFILNTQELIRGWRVYDYMAYQRYRFATRAHRWTLQSGRVDESISEELQTLDLLCFSSQYYFLIAIFSLGMLKSMFALTILLRSPKYNIFGDPMMPVIFVVMFLCCDTIKSILTKLANINVSYLGWHGLWVTKQLEGTVDDDIAAKLAIGEGRQADLEQERLELQALNSDRFRHRFLDRNRPWVLQHLVELLTPQSLQTMGPTGQPVAEYIRDVYNDIITMGEGARKPGDRSDISSDSDDDELDKRREWSRSPLEGHSLSIAKLWLNKARKRRVFWKAVEGIVQSQKEQSCSICRRTKKSCSSLIVGLAKDGELDTYAIDNLIVLFEEKYAVNEMDTNLWKSFFRGMAKYVTMCNICRDRLEQNKLNREVRFPGAERPTRPNDISSDEEEDETMFDPIILLRSSKEGKMMSKWLEAARKKLGGDFPRADAKKQMQKYAERMQRKKMQKIKMDKTRFFEADLAEEGSNEKHDDAKYLETVELSNASKALAIRWVSKARDSASKRFYEKGQDIRKNLHSALERMPVEDDWFFGRETRMEGTALHSEGEQLSLNQSILEADEAVQVRKAMGDRDEFECKIRDDLLKKRDGLEQEFRDAATQYQIKLELRTREMKRLINEVRQKNDEEERKAREEEGAVSSDMASRHRDSIREIEKSLEDEAHKMELQRQKEEAERRAFFAQEEAVILCSVKDNEREANMTIDKIRRKFKLNMETAEKEWRVKASLWLRKGMRKVEVKAAEDQRVGEAEEQRRRNMRKLKRRAH